MIRPRWPSITTAENGDTLYQATDQAFKDFLFAAIRAGQRPFCELARLTAVDVEQTPRGMLWRAYVSKTKKTRKLPVRPEVASLVCRLMKTAPRGSGKPLFRNPQDNPWKKVTGVAWILEIKSKLGWNRDATQSRYCCYTCRHTFAHRMLSGYWNGGAGCSIAGCRLDD